MNAGFRKYIAGLLGYEASVLSFDPVGGGSINETYRINAVDKTYFCKLNSASRYPELFEKEAAGLEAIEATACIQTPKVIGTYYLNDHQLLLLEWIEGGSRTSAFWKSFGEQLAKMHLWKDQTIPVSPGCGFKENNYMGALPQLNEPMESWNDFFRERRLKPQLELANQQNLMPASLLHSFEKVYAKLSEIFPPEPVSLLHGDLWSGNFLCSESEQPVLIDPAVYYGHRSMDLAMTSLFGGFDKAFYNAYTYWYPLPANYREQWEVCNLYPLLIHLNLFGKSYLPSIESCLRRFR